MKNIRFYIVIFMALILSVTLFGVSFSKQTDMIEDNNNVIKIYDGIKVVHSNYDGMINVSFTNSNKEELFYILDFGYDKYVINDKEYDKDNYYIGYLNSLGNDKDYSSYVIKSTNNSFKVLRKDISLGDLANNENYIFSYIIYNSEIYYIAGIVGEEVSVINNDSKEAINLSSSLKIIRGEGLELDPFVVEYDS